MASPNELSFLPDDYLERKAQRRTNLIFALLFFIEMLAIAGTFVISERANVAVDNEHETVGKTYTEAAKRIQLKQQLEQKQATMEKQAELSASLLEKIPRSYLMAKITNSLPAGVSLIDVNLESKLRPGTGPAPMGSKTAFEQKKSATDPKKPAAPPVQQAKVFDVNMKVTGVAFTDVQVAQFISKLNTLPVFKDVNLIISDEYKDADEGQQLRKFQLELTVNSNADISSDLEQSKTAAADVKEIK
jgi:hypothetical protein